MKFTKDNQDDILSNLGEGVELVGELTFTRGLRSDGTIKGQIRSESLFEIGQKGKVEAEITIKRITINGEFRGTIRASAQSLAGRARGNLS